MSSWVSELMPTPPTVAHCCRICVHPAFTLNRWAEAIEGLSVQFLHESPENWTEENLRKVWSLFHASETGGINAEELNAAMAKVGINLDPEQLNEVVRYAIRKHVCSDHVAACSQ